jgi:hypothetical protein
VCLEKGDTVSMAPSPDVFTWQFTRKPSQDRGGLARGTDVEDAWAASRALSDSSRIDIICRCNRMLAEAPNGTAENSTPTSSLTRTCVSWEYGRLSASVIISFCLSYPTSKKTKRLGDVVRGEVFQTRGAMWCLEAGRHEKPLSGSSTLEGRGTAKIDSG